MRRWRTGASAIGLGNALVALSVAGMLIAGPRVLDAAPFAGLGVAWTVTTVFGFGLAVPLEQVWTRRLAGGMQRGSVALWTVIAAAVIVFAVVVPWASRSPATAAFPAFAMAAGSGLAGWVAASYMRSSLAGRGDLGRYAVTLGVEAFARLLLVLSALLAPDGTWLLAASVGTPLLAAGCAGLGGGHEPPPVARDVRHSALEAPYVIGAAFGYQACLNGMPLFLSSFGTIPAPLVGTFVLANSYFRVPTVLAGGFATQTLVRAGTLGAGRQRIRSHDVRGDVLAAAGWATALGVPLLLLSGPVLSELVGRPHGLGIFVLAALSASSVAAVAAAVLTAFFVGNARARVPAVAWSLGTLAMMVPVARAGGHLGAGFAVGIFIGPCLTLAVLAVILFRDGRIHG
ncbi:hypothetical protein [Knoellia sp. p5-6-4]|uniref:hypothetical protein n=1 Tax=unclassified Knoellia TaxID=2618719 RepID=UPI0023DA555A|nr:hypothetical protein [Knoellia sp. p5-6-4]MDF2146432.1 hypothetical protein [Knoellia sp. p5-6-4]